MTEAKNVNVRCIFHLRWHATGEHGNDECWQVNETTVCLKFWKEEYCLTINFVTWKCLLLIFKFFALINLLFSYEQLFSPQPTFLECIHIFLLSDRPDLSRWPQIQYSTVILFPNNLKVSWSMATENISFFVI